MTGATPAHPQTRPDRAKPATRGDVQPEDPPEENPYRNIESNAVDARVLCTAGLLLGRGFGHASA